MNILLTGSNGFVGSEIKKYFLKKKNFFLFLPIHKENKFIKSKNSKQFYCNLSNPIKLNKKIDIIIHCASKDRQSSKTNKKKNIFEQNIKITKNIINFANKKKVKKIFFMSTMMIYKKTKKNKKIVFEEDFFNNDLYAKSKFLSEKMFCSEKNSFKTICLRLPGVLTLSNDKGPILMKIIKQIKDNKNLKVFNLDNKFNNIIDTREIFKFININLKRNIKTGVVQLAAMKPLLFKEVIQIIKRELNSNSKFIKIKNNSNSFLISVKKINKLYNFKPSSTKQIILRYCRSLRNFKYQQ